MAFSLVKGYSMGYSFNGGPASPLYSVFNGMVDLAELNETTALIEDLVAPTKLLKQWFVEIESINKPAFQMIDGAEAQVKELASGEIRFRVSVESVVFTTFLTADKLSLRVPNRSAKVISWAAFSYWWEHYKLFFQNVSGGAFRA